MKIEVSNGEILDKLSILEIKLSRINDPAKLLNIKKEFKEIELVAADLRMTCTDEYEQLKKINEDLWETEDRIRELEREGNFGELFIRQARSVYQFNDERARIKKDINIKTNSDLTEEKSYAGY